MSKSKYGDLIEQARKQDNQNTSEVEKEAEVNLCIKVPISLRRHWASVAKKQGTTMTAVIMEALEAKFGLPD